MDERERGREREREKEREGEGGEGELMQISLFSSTPLFLFLPKKCP